MSQSSKQRALALENALALAIRGKNTVASGSKSDKGDAKSVMFRCEAKYRSNLDRDERPFISLDLTWLEEIYRYADAKKQVPVLALEWAHGVRAALIPLPEWEAWRGAGDFCQFTGSGRGPRLYDTHVGDVIRLPELQVACQHWVILSWEEFERYVEGVQPPEDQPPGGFSSRKPISQSGSSGFSKNWQGGGSSLGSGSRGFGGGGGRGLGGGRRGFGR